MRIIIDCLHCKQKKEHHAKLLCRNCYAKTRPLSKRILPRGVCSECGRTKCIKKRKENTCTQCSKPMIWCKECLQLKHHQAKGCCAPCYDKISYMIHGKKTGRKPHNELTELEKIKKNIAKRAWHERNKDFVSTQKKLKYKYGVSIDKNIYEIMRDEIWETQLKKHMRTSV